MFTALTVVLPTYNERDNLRPMLDALLSLALPGVALRVLVVDDNSPDGTGELADELAAESGGRVSVLHRAGKEGLGRAYLAGFVTALEQGAELIVQMDCDFSHQPADVARLLTELTTHNADVVLGSRFAPGGGVDQTWAWWRKALSRFANGWYVRLLLGTPLQDATGGFRLWRAATLRGLDPERHIRCNGYGFQVEMAYLALKLGYRVREMPIYFPDRQRGQSKMSLTIQLEAAWQVFAMRRRHRRLSPADRAAVDQAPLP